MHCLACSCSGQSESETSSQQVATGQWNEWNEWTLMKVRFIYLFIFLQKWFTCFPCVQAAEISVWSPASLSLGSLQTAYLPLCIGCNSHCLFTWFTSTALCCCFTCLHLKHYLIYFSRGSLLCHGYYYGFKWPCLHIQMHTSFCMLSYFR